MNEPTPNPTPAPARTGLWARLRGHILHPELTPEQVAWSFAIGFAIAWNPLLGTHTWMILAICFAFRRLHRPLMLIAAFINNPWTMVPMATASAYLGNLLLGRGLDLDLRQIRWHEIGWRSFSSWEGLSALHAMVRPILVPYLLGGFVFTGLALVVGYFGMRWSTIRLRRVHWKDLHLPHPHLHVPGHGRPGKEHAEPNQPPTLADPGQEPPR